MARKSKTLIEDRIVEVTVGLTASVQVAETLWEKFSHSVQFEILDGDDVEDLTLQARALVEKEINREVDEAYEQARELRRAQRAGK